MGREKRRSLSPLLSSFSSNPARLYGEMRDYWERVSHRSLKTEDLSLVIDNPRW